MQIEAKTVADDAPHHELARQFLDACEATLSAPEGAGDHEVGSNTLNIAMQTLVDVMIRREDRRPGIPGGLACGLAAICAKEPDPRHVMRWIFTEAAQIMFGLVSVIGETEGQG